MKFEGETPQHSGTDLLEAKSQSTEFRSASVPQFHLLRRAGLVSAGRRA